MQCGAAGFARPKIADPFIFDENGVSPGIGVWQMGARWSVMNLNSNVHPRQTKIGQKFESLSGRFQVAF